MHARLQFSPVLLRTRLLTHHRVRFPNSLGILGGYTDRESGILARSRPSVPFRTLNLTGRNITVRSVY